jgi:Cysteine-rich CWC
MTKNLARCMRCGGDFHCGADDPETPCACKAIALDAQTLAALRERYTGCLCLLCLREIQRNEPSRAEAPST